MKKPLSLGWLPSWDEDARRFWTQAVWSGWYQAIMVMMLVSVMTHTINIYGCKLRSWNLKLIIVNLFSCKWLVDLVVRSQIFSTSTKTRWWHVYSELERNQLKEMLDTEEAERGNIMDDLEFRRRVLWNLNNAHKILLMRRQPWLNSNFLDDVLSLDGRSIQQWTWSVPDDLADRILLAIKPQAKSKVVRPTFAQASDGNGSLSCIRCGLLVDRCWKPFNLIQAVWLIRQWNMWLMKELRQWNWWTSHIFDGSPFLKMNPFAFQFDKSVSAITFTT